MFEKGTTHSVYRVHQFKIKKKNRTIQLVSSKLDRISKQKRPRNPSFFGLNVKNFQDDRLEDHVQSTFDDQIQNLPSSHLNC